jgi:6-phosphogluconolactonase
VAEPVKGAQPPGTQRLFVLASPEELARAAAGRLWGIVRERAALTGRGGRATGRIAVALSGGETPRGFLAALAAEPYRARFPWDRVHFFQVDERWVPPDDPRSNQRMLRERLVAQGPVPEENFHPVDTSARDAAAGAVRYEQALRRAFPDPPGGFPRFDAVLLGLGEDGHTASLFPGSPALEEETAWVAAAEGGSPPVTRVTLTLPVLNAASHVIFLVSGKGKARALRDVVLGRARERYPAARVRPRRGKVTFLADASAATRVSGGGIPGERKEVGSA